MKKLNIVLLVLSLFCCVVGYVDGQTNVDSNYDPRLPNAIGVVPSTWRTVLAVFTQAETTAAIATDTANWQAADASVTLLIPSTFGTMASETATNYAGNAGANIVAVTFRAALGVLSEAELATKSAALAGLNTQDFSAKDLSSYGKISHILASGGYTIYQGNTAVSAEGEAGVVLPLNAAATSITLASGTCGYATAEVTGKLESTNSMCHVRFSWNFENLDNTYSIVGSPASTTTQLNATGWSVNLGSDGSLTASGTPGALWQVKKLEIGGL